MVISNPIKTFILSLIYSAYKLLYCYNEDWRNAVIQDCFRLWRIYFFLSIHEQEETIIICYTIMKFIIKRISISKRSMVEARIPRWLYFVLNVCCIFILIWYSCKGENFEFNGTEFGSQPNFTNKGKISNKLLISTINSTSWTSQRKTRLY